MVCSQSPFLTSSCSQVRAVPGLRQEEQPLWIPAWFLRGIITPLCHPSHGPGVEMIWGMCESIPVSSWQSQPPQCCSCQQSGEPPASPLGCPALAPPHSSPCSKVRAFTIPQSMASSVTHLLFLCRGHQVRRGHGVPHGAALAGQEQPLQGEAQLHHTLCR